MARMIVVVPNKGGGNSSSSPSLVFGVRHGDFDACRHLRPCLSLEYRFMMIFPQSSEEDITSVSIVGWIINRRIDCCIRIVGLSGMLFWDWGD
jgi:hypothetical protein